jgi:methionyl-tRNA formyltransferase
VLQAQPAPGTIILPNKDLIIATGNGALNITQLKIEGGKIITGRDFMNGQRIKPMEKFSRQ